MTTPPALTEQGPALHPSLKERIRDTRFGGYLRQARAAVLPKYKRDAIDNRNLSLLLSFALAEDANCIDVGAYRGVILAEMLRAAPRGKHIAYEPLPNMYEYLCQHFPGADIRHAAVCNQAGERSFTHLKRTPGHSGFSQRYFSQRQGVETIRVRAVTLDQDLPADYVPALLKIDVEGAERLVLEGALTTLTRYKPIVVFEHGRRAADYYDTRPEQIYALLHDTVGLRIFDMDGDWPYTLRRFQDTFASNKHWNFVARP
jgi:FkbM family methyltransferase